MSRRRAGLLGFVLVVAAGVMATVVWALLQPPDFYAEAIARPVEPVVRRDEAKTFVQKTLQLVDEVKRADEWSQEFDQDHVNSWIAEDLQKRYSDLIPPGVSEPRVQFTDGWVDIGFRYTKNEATGIVSVRLRAWAPSPNRLAIEIHSIRAGLVPLPLDQVLDEIVRRTKLDRLRIERKRSNGADVLLVHLDGHLPGDAVLESVGVSTGKLQVSGRRATDAERKAARTAKSQTLEESDQESDGAEEEVVEEPASAEN